MTKQEYANLKADEFNLLATMGALDDALDQLKISKTAQHCLSFKLDDGVELECIDNHSHICVGNDVVMLEPETQKNIYNYLQTQ